jgi:hypothetical protein
VWIFQILNTKKAYANLKTPNKNNANPLILHEVLVFRVGTPSPIVCGYIVFSPGLQIILVINSSRRSMND